MKNIFKINILTYLIILGIMLCGYFNYLLIIIFILGIHDIGHICFMRLFKVRICKIEVLPFGSIIESDIKYNIRVYKECLIALGGVIFQVILFIIMKYLFNYRVISLYSYKIFLRYNQLIMMFNLIPIKPLDGAKVLLSVLSLFMPYKYSMYVSNGCSLCLIIVFIYLNSISLNSIFICILMFMYTYKDILSIKIMYYKFMLERYLDGVSYRRLAYVTSGDMLYKEKFNFIKGESEIKYLRDMFGIKGR